MPTTRRRRTRTRIAGPLNPALIDYLLYGRCRPPAEVEMLPPAERDAYDGFVEFDPHPPEELAALWRAHRTALFVKYWRDGGKGMPPGWRQFGRPVDDDARGE